MYERETDSVSCEKIAYVCAFGPVVHKQQRATVIYFGGFCRVHVMHTAVMWEVLYIVINKIVAPTADFL